MTKTAPEMARPGLLRHLPLVVVALAALAGAIFLRDDLSLAALQTHQAELIAYRDAHYLQAALLFMLAYSGIVAFSLPGATLATLTGGFLFGLFPGVLFNVTAATIGAIGIFLAARLGLGAAMARRLDAAPGMVGRLKAGIDANQWSMLFVMRLLPVVPFFVANLVPALVGVPLSRFAVSTFFGIIPGGLIYTSVGSGLGAVLAEGGSPDLGVIFQPQILLPIIGLCALALLPLIYRLWLSRKGARP